MAAQGLGYFETDDKENKRFIELPSSDTSELEDAKKVLENAKGQEQKITDSCKADQKKLDQQRRSSPRLAPSIRIISDCSRRQMRKRQKPIPRRPLWNRLAVRKI